MPIYRTHEAALDLPNGWTDATINVLEYTRSSGVLRLGVSRVARGAKGLVELIEDRLVEQRRKLPFFEIVSRADRVVVELACVDLVARYRDGEQVWHQRTASFVMGYKLVVLAATGPISLAGDADAIFEKALATLTLRDRSGMK